MKKAVSSICAIFLAVLIVCSGGCSCTFEQKESDYLEEIAQRTVSDWHDAQWIWWSDTAQSDCGSAVNAQAPDTWVNFVKAVTLTSVPKHVYTGIATDGKYWLYINGRNAVFEGGLKRGPTRTETYYDEVDIAPFLHKGENKIAILARYYGKHSYSHVSSGKAGLLFCANVSKDEYIVSDSSWKASYNYSYQKDTGSDQPNSRITEANVYYDFNAGNDGWYSMDDEEYLGWNNALTEGGAGCAPWNGLKKRPIPLLKDYGLKDYLNSAEYTNNGQGYVVSADTAITLEVPYNTQLTPYIDVCAPKDGVVRVRGDNYEDPAGNGKSVMNSMVSNGKRVQWEGLDWFNAQYVTYTVPSGSTIYALKYRETGYDTEFSASFTCNDDFYNTLYGQCVRTLYVNMRDSFTDCPDRERAQWLGDVNSDMTMIPYAFSPSAYALYEKCVYEVIGWTKDLGYMPTVCPTGKSLYELPLQNLAFIWGISEYYNATGNEWLLIDAYPMAKSYLLKWNIDVDGTGLVVHRGGTWDWGDWGSNIDIAPQENAWYVLALKSVMLMAELSGNASDLAVWQERCDSITANYDSAFWKADKQAYYNATTNGEADDRANAMAVFAGLASAEKYDGIIEVLKNTENASPYLENYVVQAMCQMGYVKEAQARIKARYADMVNCGYSTLWEFWDRNEGTSNHAWSGGPLLAMSKWFAGITPTEAGYKKYTVKPNLGDLTSIRFSLETVQGKISLSVQQTADEFSVMLTNPQGSQATVYVKKTSAQATVTVSATSGVTLQNQTADYWIYSVDNSKEVTFTVK